MKEHRTFLDFPAKTFHAVTISISTLRKFGSVFFLSKENTTYASQIFAAIHFRKQKSLWKNKALCILLHRQHFAMNCSCSLFFLFVLQKCCLNCFASHKPKQRVFQVGNVCGHLLRSVEKKHMPLQSIKTGWDADGLCVPSLHMH